MTFLLSRQADRALEQVWDFYFEQGGTRLADRVLAEIRDAIHRLIAQPTLGHFRLDLTDRPLRFYRVFKIFLIYDPNSNPIYIARVYHSSQDVQTRMNRESD
jgi:plasmid stabilization system protein ParE